MCAQPQLLRFPPLTKTPLWKPLRFANGRSSQLNDKRGCHVCECSPSRCDHPFLPISPHHALVAHDCGYPLSRYTCRATRVAADFLDFIEFCRCSTGVAPHPLKISVSHLSPPPFPGGVAPKFGSEKVSRFTGVSQVQLRVSRYTVQLSIMLCYL